MSFLYPVNRNWISISQKNLIWLVCRYFLEAFNLVLNWTRTSGAWALERWLVAILGPLLAFSIVNLCRHRSNTLSSCSIISPEDLGRLYGFAPSYHYPRRESSLTVEHVEDTQGSICRMKIHMLGLIKFRERCILVCRLRSLKCQLKRIAWQRYRDPQSSPWRLFSSPTSECSQSWYLDGLWGDHVALSIQGPPELWYDGHELLSKAAPAASSSSSRGHPPAWTSSRW